MQLVVLPSCTTEHSKWLVQQLSRYLPDLMEDINNSQHSLDVLRTLLSLCMVVFTNRPVLVGRDLCDLQAHLTATTTALSSSLLFTSTSSSLPFSGGNNNNNKYTPSLRWLGPINNPLCTLGATRNSDPLFSEMLATFADATSYASRRGVTMALADLNTLATKCICTFLNMSKQNSATTFFLSKTENGASAANRAQLQQMTLVRTPRLSTLSLPMTYLRRRNGMHIWVRVLMGTIAIAGMLLVAL